jgi:Tfp pilus assembly protein PilF
MLKVNNDFLVTMKRIWPVLISACFLLAGCVSQQAQLQVAEKPAPVADDTRKALSFDSSRFGEPPEIISVEDIFGLTYEQEEAFLKYFESPIRQFTPPHELVSGYLQNITMDFGYQGQTFTAQEALQSASGNCLSLAILTTALAKLAGVETGYQLVDSAPVFESRGNIVYKGQHVRTKLYSPVSDVTTGSFLLRRNSLLVDYFPTEGTRFVRNITEAQYIAMFYNNLASEAIAREDYDAAFWLLLKTLELTPEAPGAINSMAVIHRRIGDLNKAEEIYQYGIAHLDDKISFLRNYRVLLEQQGRFDEVAQINRQLTALDDPSPFDWLHAGHNAYSEGNYQEAVLLYRKAAKIAPYLHESYAGLAKAYYMIGDRHRAEREFRNALEKSQRSSTRSMYEAKLMVLSQNS